MEKLSIVLLLVVCWQGCLVSAETDPRVLQDLLERVEHIQNVLMKRVYPAVQKVDELDREVATIRRTTPEVSEILQRVQDKIEQGEWKQSPQENTSETSERDSVSTNTKILDGDGTTYEEKRAQFFNAATWGNLNLLRSLIAAGFNYLEIDSEDINQSALHKAAKAGHKDIVEALLAAGVPTLMIDTQDVTPLHEAALWGHPEVASVLIKAGARVNAKDIKGATPLHDAAYQGGGDVAKVLIEAGADVDAEDKSGETPLHRAARWGKKDAVQLLIDSKANVDARSDDGSTALHEAIKGNVNSDITVRMLIRAGANKYARNFLNKTPRDIAVSKKLNGLADIL